MSSLRGSRLAKLDLMHLRPKSVRTCPKTPGQEHSQGTYEDLQARVQLSGLRRGHTAGEKIGPLAPCKLRNLVGLASVSNLTCRTSGSVTYRESYRCLGARRVAHGRGFSHVEDLVISLMHLLQGYLVGTPAMPCYDRLAARAGAHQEREQSNRPQCLLAAGTPFVQ